MDSALIAYESLGSATVRIRKSDGFMSATDICKAGSRVWAPYYQNKQTHEFINTLSSHIGIPICDLVQIKKGGPNKGTWVHPDIAIDLAYWISAEFKIYVIGIVRKYISNDLSLINDIVEKNNADTGTVSNLIIASNPVDSSYYKNYRS